MTALGRAVKEGEDEDDAEAAVALIEPSMSAKSPSSSAVGRESHIVPPSPTLSTPSTISSFPKRSAAIRLSSSLSSMLANTNGFALGDWNRPTRPKQTPSSATATTTSTPQPSLLRVAPGRVNCSNRRHSGVNNSVGVGGASGGASNSGGGAGLAFSNKINQVR